MNFSDRMAADAEFKQIKTEYKTAKKAYRKRKNKEGIENLKAAFSNPVIAGFFIFWFSWTVLIFISSLF